MTTDQIYDELYGALDTRTRDLIAKINAVAGAETSAIGALTSAVGSIQDDVSSMRGDITDLQNAISSITSGTYHETVIGDFTAAPLDDAGDTGTLTAAYTGFDIIRVRGVYSSAPENYFYVDIPVSDIRVKESEASTDFSVFSITDAVVDTSTRIYFSSPTEITVQTVTWIKIDKVIGVNYDYVAPTPNASTRKKKG